MTTDRPSRSLLHTLRLTVSLVWRGRVVKPFCSAWARLSLKAWGARVGRHLTVRGWLRVHNCGRIVIGDNVTINSGPANYVGGDRRMAMWVGRDGTLTIGDGCGMSSTTIVCLNQIDILPQTFIGGGCEIYDTDFHPLDAQERIACVAPPPVGTITIGPKAFVGGFSIILKNVTIGEGAVIGAGSIVTKSVPPFEVWAGVPARFIRKLGVPQYRETSS